MRSKCPPILRTLDGSSAEERLFVITPDAHMPEGVPSLDDDRVTWFNFESLSAAIVDLLEDAQELVSERASYLLRELKSFFYEEGLIGQTNDIVVVAA